MSSLIKSRMAWMQTRRQFKIAMANIDLFLRALSVMQETFKAQIEHEPSLTKKEALLAKARDCLHLYQKLELVRCGYENAVIQAEVSPTPAKPSLTAKPLCSVFGLEESQARALFFEDVLTTAQVNELLEKALDRASRGKVEVVAAASSAPSKPWGKGSRGEKTRRLPEYDDESIITRHEGVRELSPSLEELIGEAKPKPEPVAYSILSPKAIQKGESFLLDFFMYEKEYEHIVKEALAQAGENTQRKDAGLSFAEKGSPITVKLYSPSLPDLADEDSFVWLGGYHASQLAGFIPADYPSNTVLLCVDILVYGLKVTTLKAVVQLESNQKECPFLRVDIKKAFFSYSSEDRDTVLTLKQGMEGLCPEVECYVDFIFLRGGQQWLNEIHHKIDQSDCLFLIWSENAYKSEWVKEEWTYALGTRGIEFIHPLAIEAVDKKRCPVPKALESIHFGNLNAMLRSR